MPLIVNPGKKRTVDTDNGSYDRYAIQTHFIKIGEDLNALLSQYVVPVYQPGDIVTVSEKILSLCQKRVIYKSEMKICPLARFLSKFASTSEAGIGVNSVWKMQVTIDFCGAWTVLFAAVCSGIGKLFGKKEFSTISSARKSEDLTAFMAMHLPNMKTTASCFRKIRTRYVMKF